MTLLVPAVGEQRGGHADELDDGQCRRYREVEEPDHLPPDLDLDGGEFGSTEDEHHAERREAEQEDDRGGGSQGRGGAAAG